MKSPGRRIYRVVVYCPDRHIVYDGRLPDRRGVGGGLTARIRLASALARRGHAVTVVCNCPRPTVYAGVRYLPLGTVRRIDADVLVLNTTGGAMDIREVTGLQADVRLRMLWVNGVVEPQGLHDVPFDVLCAPSNFVRRVARDTWGIAPEKLVVFHNGVVTAWFREPPWRGSTRDPYRLAYSAHPSKGLASALGILRLLRAVDRRFTLHAYGGDAMYGGVDSLPASEPGFTFHGTLPQPQLARELQRAGFALNLQDREEPFGIALVEGMAAGCIVVASPVGAYPEIVCGGWNGFLVAGDHRDPSTWARAAALIVALTRNEAWARRIRAGARATPLDWAVIAQAWEEYWVWRLGETAVSQEPFDASCVECDGPLRALADGYHCTACGWYGTPA